MATLTEAETRALVCSSLLVVLAALGRSLLQPPVGRVDAAGMVRAGDLDSALAVAESLHSDQERRRRPLIPGERIDINTAGESELDRLPGGRHRLFPTARLGVGRGQHVQVRRVFARGPLGRFFGPTYRFGTVANQ